MKRVLQKRHTGHPQVPPPTPLSTLSHKCLSSQPLKSTSSPTRMLSCPQCLILSAPILSPLSPPTHQPSLVLHSSQALISEMCSLPCPNHSPLQHIIISIPYATTQTSSPSVSSTCLLTSKGHHFLRPQELYSISPIKSPSQITPRLIPSPTTPNCHSPNP